MVLALPWLAGALALAPLLLFVPSQPDPLGIFTVQLLALVALGVGVTIRIAPLADGGWFRDTQWTDALRRFGGVVVLVVIATGVVALVTLATAAALRFDPSLQFLQLLSALDIAWAAAALYLGVRWWRGVRAARLAAVTLAALCLVSVWNYLRVVGFGPDGEWVVDGGQLLRLVLPFDMAAAVMAVGSVVVGLRRTS